MTTKKIKRKRKNKESTYQISQGLLIKQKKRKKLQIVQKQDQNKKTKKSKGIN